MKSCIVSFLLIGCLVSSSYSKLPGLMNPGAGADLKAKSTTMESGIWTDDDIKSGKSFEEQEQGLLVKAVKSGCNCSADVSMLDSLNSQLELIKLPTPTGKDMHLSLQNVKIALKMAFVPLNVATVGVAYVILDRIIPTQGSPVESILNIANAKDLTTYLVSHAIQTMAGAKYETYADKFKLTTDETSCDEICKADSPAIESLKEVLAQEQRLRPQVTLGLQSVKLALKVAFAPYNALAGGTIYGILDAVIPTKEPAAWKMLNLANPKEIVQAAAELTDVAIKYGSDPKKLHDVYNTLVG